jgi:hypothetical protein
MRNWVIVALLWGMTMAVSVLATWTVSNRNGRYQMHLMDKDCILVVLDTSTGEVYTQHGSNKWIQLAEFTEKARRR